MDGQMTLFEYEERISYKEPEKLLKMGQMVYVVQKGDVEKQGGECGGRTNDFV